MSHEKSITIKRNTPKGVRWFNLDNVGDDVGRVLGTQSGFKTQDKAVKAAEARSKRFRGVHSPRDRGRRLK